MKIKETKFARPFDGFRVSGHVHDEDYEDFIFKYHDNGWVLLAIRPDGLHIFGKYEGVEYNYV